MITTGRWEAVFMVVSRRGRSAHLGAILQIKPFAFGPDPTGAGYERRVGEE